MKHDKSSFPQVKGDGTLPADGLKHVVGGPTLGEERGIDGAPPGQGFVVMDAIPQEQPAAIVQLAQADTASVQAKLVARAKADGWSPSQADWIGKIGLAAMNGQLDGAPAAFDAAYKEARRILTAGYFDNALKEGKSRLVAFLTVIDLEKQIAERAGNPVPHYSEEALKAAYVVLAAAAEGGASTADQIEIAFASLRAPAAQGK